MMIAVSTRAPDGSGGTESAVTVTAEQGNVVVTVEESPDGGVTLHARRGQTVLCHYTGKPHRPTSRT